LRRPTDEQRTWKLSFVEVLAEAERVHKMSVSIIKPILKTYLIECERLNRIGWETG